jgi:hypothetical protein
MQHNTVQPYLTVERKTKKHGILTAGRHWYRVEFCDNVLIIPSRTFVSEEAVLGCNFKHGIGDVNNR